MQPLSTIIAPLILLIPILIGNEALQELDAMDVVAEAENFALERNTRPEKLLILDVSRWLVKRSVRLNACLLVLRPISDEFVASSGRQVVPLFLMMLAANLKVIVISASPWYKPSMLGSYASTPDPFQNFRHNCILHIAIDEPHKLTNTMFVNTLFWKMDGTRKFICVESFDHMLYWIENIPPRSCFRSRKLCAMQSIYFEKSKIFGIPRLFLRSMIRCNSTTYRASFNPDEVHSLQSGAHAENMVKQYSMARITAHECFSLIHRREIGISALIEPFESSVWYSTFFSILILVIVISWLRIDTFESCMSRSVLSLITVVEVRADVRRYSHLLVIGSALALLFVVGRVYTNSFTSFFLDPREFKACVEALSCRTNMACYSRKFLRDHLFSGRCVCSLNQKQLGLADMPLRREVFIEGYQIPPGLEPKDDVRNLKNHFLQKELTMNPMASEAHRGQLLFVLIRVSASIDRLFRTGLLLNLPSQFTEAEVRKYLAGPLNRITEAASMTMNNESRFKLMEFNTPADRFDIGSLMKLIPIYEGCVTIIFFAFALECLLGIIQKIKHRQDARRPRMYPGN